MDNRCMNYKWDGSNINSIFEIKLLIEMNDD